MSPVVVFGAAGTNARLKSWLHCCADGARAQSPSEAASDLEGLRRKKKPPRRPDQTEAKSSHSCAKAAPKLAQSVTQAMQNLGMQGGRFEVALIGSNQAAQHGLEEAFSFCVAGHAGSTPRPVGKVASGGELSRIALAIAVTTSELGEAGTLIFDEVDSGVGAQWQKQSAA
jgi:DNA repair protein RecN (Recombination protein N)